MKIVLVTPPTQIQRSGNRTTANRWARLLKRLGHSVRVDTTYRDGWGDLMIAIHAWRSACAARSFKMSNPHAPLVVLLSGTDIYRFQHSNPETTVGTMELADRLVGVHECVERDIPQNLTNRLRIIYQSCAPLSAPRQPLKRYFQVCVVAHSRTEKDPLRIALAARRRPASSKLRVVLLGGAHDHEWADKVGTEARDNPRFLWKGEVSRAKVRRCFSNSHAMVISSTMEGGANVVSEAIVAGLPVIASDIAGNRGLLGDLHCGYFPVNDDRELARLLYQAESEPNFLTKLVTNASKNGHRFSPEFELESWRTLLDELR